MSSFFTLPASQRKRKRTDDRSGNSTKRRGIERKARADDQSERQNSRAKDTGRDESISGSESEVEQDLETGEESEATSEEEENAADRRVRLAQRYLDNLREEVDEAGFDAEDIDRDLLAQRLKEDVDEAKGRQYRLIASRLDFNSAQSCSFRADTESTTAVAVCQPYAYTVSKDKTLIKWELTIPSLSSQSQCSTTKPLRKRPKQVDFIRGIKIRASAPLQHGHTGPILSLAASPDGKYVATGGADKKLIIWSAQDLRPLKTFTTHRDAVTGLAFAPQSSSQPGYGAQLFSASMDRSIKTYSLAGEESLAYVETLFGHQDHVLAVSAMALDQCVSVGARDRSARLWRVVDETQLKFLGDSSKHQKYHTGSMECVAALPPQHFVTGSDSGAISLWSVHKKKALCTVETAHGVEQPPPLETVTSESDPKVIANLKEHDTRRPIPRAITALVTLPGTDVVLSGSWDGWIRVWKLSDDKKALLSLGVVGDRASEVEHPNGNLNGITISDNGHSKSEQESISAQAIEQGPINGIVNSLAAFERRKQVTNEFGGKKEGECQGLSIVAGIGKELRLGRWLKLPHGKNGAMVFEVPLINL